MYILDPYQERLLFDTNRALLINTSVLCQSETGSGKTVIFSAMASSFIKKFNENVIIFVHKKELLDKTRQTLYSGYGIVSQKIDSKTKFIQPNVRVFVAMVETFNNRSKLNNFLDNFKNVGLVIVDECHLSNFKKIFGHFLSAKRIGFTATPVAATKKDPLNRYYGDIVTGPTIKELIEVNKRDPNRGVVPAVEWALGSIDRNSFKIDGDEFNEESVGKEFSKTPRIKETVEAYITKAYGLKTICFNSTIEHSLKVTQAFREGGFNVRHLDGNKNGQYGTDKYREETFYWLSTTSNAILCNVGIATTGFDDPSIMNVINNSSMMSMTLFRQKRGRGGRPHRFSDGSFKTHFVHLDMGNNIVGGGFGEWIDEVPWEEIFRNPKKPLPSIGVCKSCPECGALRPISERFCKGLVEDWLAGGKMECGYEFPVKEKEEDETPREMVLITSGIDVRKNIEFFADKHEFYSMHQTIIQIANKARKEIIEDYLDVDRLYYLYNITCDKVGEWFKLKGRRKFDNFKQTMKANIIDRLREFGFLITPEEIAELDEKIEQTSISKKK